MYFEGGLPSSLKSIGDWNKLWADLKNGKMDNLKNSNLQNFNYDCFLIIHKTMNTGNSFGVRLSCGKKIANQVWEILDVHLKANSCMILWFAHM